MDCDAIASSYFFCERLAFGTRLEKHRLWLLGDVTQCRRALVLGDGDGRFLQRLAASNSEMRIDAVELSRNMVSLAKRRVGRRVSFLIGDARRMALPETEYDLIVAHFFLDCFQQEELTTLVKKVARHCSPDALWLISEFAQPSRSWPALNARIWLFTMYLFFRIATGLTTRSLPDYRTILSHSGFEVLQRRTSMGGLICSELWQVARAGA